MGETDEAMLHVESMMHKGGGPSTVCHMSQRRQVAVLQSTCNIDNVDRTAPILSIASNIPKSSTNLAHIRSDCFSDLLSDLSRRHQPFVDASWTSAIPVPS